MEFQYTDNKGAMGYPMAVLKAGSHEPYMDQWSLDEWLPSDASFKFPNKNRCSASPADELFSHGQLQSQNSSKSAKSSSFHSTTSSQISGNTGSSFSRNASSVSRSTSGGSYRRNFDLGSRKKLPTCDSVKNNRAWKPYLEFPGWHICLPTRPSASSPTQKTDSPKSVKEKTSSSNWASLWTFVSACKRCHGLESQ